MKISLNWIRKYTQINVSDDEIITKIASQIAEIETLTDMSKWYEGVVLAEITSAEDHPEADKLGVYQVDIGETTVQVCAGDKTLKVGDRVGYIPPGTAVPQSVAEGDPFIIETRKLRGKESNGMLGSGLELMINDSHEHVLVLGDVVGRNGSSFAEEYDLNDTIIEVENKALTHRPDAFGIIGFAREVSGIQIQKFTSPQWLFDGSTVPVSASELSLSVQNDATDNCYRFTAVAMSGIVVAPSSVMIQSFLKRHDVRPINNVVDITNFCMLTTGQPLHAFDYDKVAQLSEGEAKLVVRYAADEEKLKVLDGRTLSLTSKNIVIATDKVAISVAGAMGGSATEVDENTKNIIIEAGNFDLYNLRKTSMQHGLFTDAVTRFIRGQDPASCAPVSNYAITLMQDHAHGEVAGLRQDSFDSPREDRRVLVSAERVNALLGSALTVDVMADLLRNVELEVSVQADELAVIAPSWRPDLNIAEDIIEEVGRLYGYTKLEARLPLRDIGANLFSDLELAKRKLRQILVSSGANELLTYSFVPDSLIEQTGSDKSDAYRIRNALRPELQRLRTSLIPSIASMTYANIRRGFGEFALFEIGKSHNNKQVEDDLPIEHNGLAFIYSADEKTAKNKQGSAYYTAREYLELACSGAVLSYVKLSEASPSSHYLRTVANSFESARSAVVMAGDLQVGVIGEFNQTMLRKLKMATFSAGFEIDISKLDEARESSSAVSSYSPLSKFPSSTQDVTFSAKIGLSFADLNSAIKGSATDGDVSIDWFAKDIFVAENSEDKNTTIRFKFQRYDRTLTSKEVSESIERIITEVSKQVEVSVVG